MLEVSIDLTVVWAMLLGFAVFAYVLLDGFDLGVGMLFALEPKRRDRDAMMNSVAPVWDGNETWLILGGGGLFAAFPLAYALILSALYAPLMAMLLALVFRGVAFEFRWRTERWRGFWDLAFIGGSAMATFAQGVTLGAFLQGIAVDVPGRAYSGGWWDWLTPFSITCGVALVVGYCLLGSTWLVMKMSGDLERRMRRYGLVLAVATLVFIGVVSLATPFLQEGYYNRWFVGWGILLAALVGVVTLYVVWRLLQALADARTTYRPFLWSLALFVMCFVGLGFCVWPYAVPQQVTLWDAAAPEASQLFMLVGAVVLIPLILAYSGYAYWVFRGKVDPEEGYH